MPNSLRSNTDIFPLKLGNVRLAGSDNILLADPLKSFSYLDLQKMNYFPPDDLEGIPRLSKRGGKAIMAG